MATDKIPFYRPTIFNRKDVSNIGQITTLEILEPGSKNFNTNGLFSNEIFGRVGTAVRDTRFGYIDLKVGVFHPMLFKTITDLKMIYGELLSGKGYAVWDPKEKTLLSLHR